MLPLGPSFSVPTTQVSLCFLQILLFSLALIILPSVSPLQGLREAGTDDHQPQGGEAGQGGAPLSQGSREVGGRSRPV